MKVKVTQEHIDKGEKRKCETCPVALALKDATGLDWDVGAWTMWIRAAPDRPDVTMPLEVSAFIGAFDNDEPVAPFEFELAI